MEFQQDTRIWWRGIFIVCLLLAACEPVQSQDVQAIPTCISTTPEANPYLAAPSTAAATYFEQYRTGIISLQAAKLIALANLRHDTQRWSDYVDIVLKDQTGVRITITYISPALLESIVLNQLLHNDTALSGFEEELKGKLEKLAARNEMIFFVVLSASFNANQIDNSQQLVVRIPIPQMTLTNASDFSVARTHDDHILDESIPVTRKAISGYIAFPLSVIQNDQCLWIMEAPYNTTINLDVPYLEINDQQFGRQFWSIPYSSLIIQNTVPGAPPTTDPNFDLERLIPLKTPPSPVWNPSITNQSNYWDTYWQDVGRYLWHRIMLEDYP